MTKSRYFARGNVPSFFNINTALCVGGVRVSANNNSRMTLRYFETQEDMNCTAYLTNSQTNKTQELGWRFQKEDIGYVQFTSTRTRFKNSFLGLTPCSVTEAP
jgi:hypothetical protein